MFGEHGELNLAPDQLPVREGGATREIESPGCAAGEDAQLRPAGKVTTSSNNSVASIV
jgi:hypothetical protein